MEVYNETLTILTDSSETVPQSLSISISVTYEVISLAVLELKQLVLRQLQIILHATNICNN